MNANTTAIATTNYLVPSAAVETFPDNTRYKCRFTVRSDTAGGHWTCSCRGNIRHGSCKHLEAMGLKGRKYGRSRLEDGIKINNNMPALGIPAPQLTFAA